MTFVLGKRKKSFIGQQKPLANHPYLQGNFAPTDQLCSLTACPYSGKIPGELAGGQYIRNGSNPVQNADLGRDSHWFDGDGMLAGVSFKRNGNHIEPEFVNQYILTDIFLNAASTPTLRRPILPSITTLCSPFSTLLKICIVVLRTICFVILSRLPGSAKSIRKISVANTAIMYHDGRALATCESGPPLRIVLPELDTVGWFDGNRAEGEPEDLGKRESSDVFGGRGLLGFMKEWTTAHPKVDPETGEMILFHSTFVPPYVHYSVLPSTSTAGSSRTARRLLNQAVSGISSAKMMHDFGVSRGHTVIMDLPLTLDPLQLLKNHPPIHYDGGKPARFGVFGRHDPRNVRWFETRACCIFHTANTWDVVDGSGHIQTVDMLACRMTSAAVVFTAGNLPYLPGVNGSRHETPNEKSPLLADGYERGPRLESSVRGDEQDKSIPEEEQCRLYYYSFDMDSAAPPTILHQFALSGIPFEFPSAPAELAMSSTQYIYGCTSTCTTFNPALGRTSKIDALAKFNVRELIRRGRDERVHSVTGCVDRRTVNAISQSTDKDDPIKIFPTPGKYCAQEPRFVPRHDGATEDDGFLLTYVFDEAQLISGGSAPASAVSELWVIDARNMRDVIAKVYLPQRVPYGLHGNWFPEKEVVGQRPVEKVRRVLTEEEWSRGWARNFQNRVKLVLDGICA